MWRSGTSIRVVAEAFETCDEVSLLLDGSHSAIKDEKQNYPNNDSCLGEGADAK